MTEKEKRIKRYMHDIRHTNRQKNMAKNLSRSYCAPYYLETEKYLGNGKYESVDKPFVKKTYRSAGCARYRFFKKKSNRMVRKFKHRIPNGNGYRKIFDYQWEID